MFRISKAEGQVLSFWLAGIAAGLISGALPTSRDKVRSSIGITGWKPEIRNKFKG